MPETEVTGTPATGTPEAAPPPAPPPATTDIRSAAKDAVRSIREKQTTEAPKAPTPEPEQPASEPQRFLTKEEPAEKPAELSSVDWSKTAPEIQALRKELLGDYTRKTQEVAEQRKAYDEKLLQLMDRLAPKKEELPVADPRAAINQLREEGRHEEADAMVLELAKAAASEEVSGLKRQAQINELKTTFRDIVSETTANFPIVKAYEKQVAEVFDGDHPAIIEFRKLALTDPGRMKVMVPALMNLLAAEQHAITLERNYKEAVRKGIEEGIKAEKEAARKLTGPVIPSGGESKTTPEKTTGDVRKAVKMAAASLRGE